jgi:hypothetical protein
VEPVCGHTEHKNFLKQDLAREPVDTPTPVASADNHFATSSLHRIVCRKLKLATTAMVKQAVFELVEPACKRIRGQKSLHGHLNRVHKNGKGSRGSCLRSTVLRDLAAPEFQARNSAADLAQSLELRQRKFDLFAVSFATPQFSPAPQMDANG